MVSPSEKNSLPVLELKSSMIIIDIFLFLAISFSEILNSPTLDVSEDNRPLLEN